MWLSPGLQTGSWQKLPHNACLQEGGPGAGVVGLYLDAALPLRLVIPDLFAITASPSRSSTAELERKIPGHANYSRRRNSSEIPMSLLLVGYFPC